jgi:polyhydroxyalkanoate synthase
MRAEDIAAIIDYSSRVAKAMNIVINKPEVETAPTPCDVIFKMDKLKLLRYRPVKKDLCPIPVLVTYALVNKPYILDLQADRSVVQAMLNAGLDVYLIDWGTPGPTDRFITLEDYLNIYYDACTDVVLDTTGADQVTMLGYCMGGTMGMMYTILHEEKVKNQVCMASQFDFHQGEGFLNKWAMYLDIDKLVEGYGNVPAEFLNSGFLLLDPIRNYYLKYIQLIDLVDDPESLNNFLRMEKWLNDGIPVVGETYREFIKYGYQENRLVKKTWEIGGKIMDLGKVTVPVLNIVAMKDTIIPPESSLALKGHVGSKDYTLLTLDAGHIGLSVSRRAHKDLWPKACQWMIDHSK